MSIEDIILNRDRRGVSALRGHLPSNFCEEAARLILDNPGTAIITTGFYVPSCEAPETDGPPGAIVIGRALQSLGYDVVYVTDRYSVPLMASILGSEARVVDFPITDHQASERFASELLAEINPSVAISIERCGLTKDGVSLNMRGRDITQYNAKVDYLFKEHTSTVGIGDGGNEIGMGNLAHVIPTIESLPDNPCVTKVTRLIIASVSNWGGYGLVAALSLLKERILLPSVEEEHQLIRQMVDAGAVDGILGKPVYGVDAFSLEENSQTVTELHAFLDSKGINP